VCPFDVGATHQTQIESQTVPSSTGKTTVLRNQQPASDEVDCQKPSSTHRISWFGKHFVCVRNCHLTVVSDQCDHHHWSIFILIHHYCCHASNASPWYLHRYAVIVVPLQFSAKETYLELKTQLHDTLSTDVKQRIYIRTILCWKWVASWKVPWKICTL